MFNDVDDAAFRQLKNRLTSPSPTISDNGLYVFESRAADFNIEEREEKAKETLKSHVREFLGDDGSLYPIIDQIVGEGGAALRALYDDDISYLNRNQQQIKNLELVVQSDGTRPSFLIRNGAIDKTSSPISNWDTILDNRRQEIEHAISCVGRINAFGAAMGTGFLIAPNLVMTNRHVLEAIGRFEAGVWRIDESAVIDFGHEYRAIRSKNMRRLTKVIFTGDTAINKILNHNNLDMAIIEIDPINCGLRPLSVDLSDNWTEDELIIFTIGYPTSYTETDYSLLDTLFRSLLGFKRISPGRIQTESMVNVPGWTFSHDATTLGGNSGSVILAINNESVAAGLHYGGTRSPLINWGHILGGTLSTAYGAVSLRDLLEQHRVTFFS